MSTKTGRQSWLDESTQAPLIDEYTQKLSTFMEAMADGRIDSAEMSTQERRLVELMKKVEPQLSESLHGEVTQLLCELTAYNVMQTLSSLQGARPSAKLSL
jgi:hypothetical protein